MCGIVGYVGSENPKDFLLSGLEKLEYRGYDSAGIAIAGPTGLVVFKEKGRISNLKDKIDPKVTGISGIGHTRWATHGKATKENAHPHRSPSHRYALVHNGVIDNHLAIREDILSHAKFISETDTEVIVQMVEEFSKLGLGTEEAFRKSLTELQGAYAIAMIDREDPETLYCAKNKSPLLIGLGTGFNMLASDGSALIRFTDKVIPIKDNEMAIIRKDSIVVKDQAGREVRPESFLLEIDATDVELGNYPHFMIKEIDEQPFVLRNLLQKYQNEHGDLKFERGVLDAIIHANRIHIIACGTSYNAGLLGKQYLEKISRVPTEVHIASEFAYNPPLIENRSLFLFISQSGETADSRAVLVKIKEQGHKTITLTNVFGSTLSREADHTLLLYAGPEIAVASTKAYTAQVATLLLLACAVAREKNEKLPFDPVIELSIVASAIETVCESKNEIQDMAYQCIPLHAKNAFFIGRTFDYLVCLEGALKLKEISYIQTEGYAGGELKHGPIALIEEGTPVIALSTQKEVNLSIRANVQEVEARGANAYVITMKGLEQGNERYVLPLVHRWLSPLLSVVIFQLLSYYAALQRECDVDKPRNLAKSVTVE